MGKYIFTALLALMSFTAAVVSLVYRSNPQVAISLGCLCIVFFMLALIAAAYESIPKPHIVPMGYGQIKPSFKGLLFQNDGEPAYHPTPPDSGVEFGKVGTTRLIFEDPGIGRLSKEEGVQCFPFYTSDSIGKLTYDDLRMKLALTGADFVLVPIRYADGKKPTILRYTTICKIELHKRADQGLKVTPLAFKFNWLRLFF